MLTKKQMVNLSGMLSWGVCLCLFAFSAMADGNSGESKFITDLRVVANKGDAEAQYTMGNSYYIGVGVPRNYTESVRWLTMSAEQGYPKAESALGNMYYNGLGVEKSISDAIKWWTKAAGHHDGDAQDQLGFAYLLGDGVPKDDIKAYMWFNIAASNKDAHAVQDRDKISRFMISEQIAEAQRLQNDWAKSHP